jgi:hypothetical protein
MSILIHPDADAASCCRRKAGSTDHRERETLRPRSSTCSPKTEPQAVEPHRNSNVWNILPVTTLRTIDLRGTKNSDRLFSRFCTEMRAFFEGHIAPKRVQLEHALRAGRATTAPDAPSNTRALVEPYPSHPGRPVWRRLRPGESRARAAPRCASRERSRRFGQTGTGKDRS